MISIAGDIPARNPGKTPLRLGRGGGCGGGATGPHAVPSQYRWPHPPAGSGYQPGCGGCCAIETTSSVDVETIVIDFGRNAKTRNSHREAVDELTHDRFRRVVDLLMTVTIKPVGKGGYQVINPHTGAKGIKEERVKVEWR